MHGQQNIRNKALLSVPTADDKAMSRATQVARETNFLGM